MGNFPGSGHFHAVQFYESSETLGRIVSDFIATGLAASVPGLILATPEHLTLFESQLRARGFDVERLKANDHLIVADATIQLSNFMVDGMPDADLFRQTTIPLIERASRGRPDCIVRIYGEMVDVLWQAGQTVAATKLEMLWNTLAATHDFALVCGYSMGQFYKNATTNDLYRHTHVLSESGAPLAIH